MQEEGIKHIGNALNNLNSLSGLQLQLGNNKIGEIGSEYLGNSIKGLKLTKLDLNLSDGNKDISS